MKTATHIYQSDNLLLNFLKESQEKEGKTSLLQVFSGVLDQTQLKRLVTLISEQFPDLKILGTTTAGEIADGHVVDQKIVFALSVFEKTKVETFYSAELTHEAGEVFGKKALLSDAKCAILFADTFNGQPQDFLLGLEAGAPELAIAGGNAGDNNQFQGTLLIQGNQIYDKGIVGCYLVSDELKVYQDYVLNWTPIGPTMTITKCQGSTIYEIDDVPVAEVYKKYLGSEVIENLPNSIMEFPLIIQSEDMQVGRSSVGVTDDMGFAFAGVFNEGDQVRFGIADINTILLEANNKAEYVAEHVPLESVFVYSCTARRSFLKDHIDFEIKSLSHLSETTGFFTYGEFYHSNRHNQQLNITTTFLALSESSTKLKKNLKAQETVKLDKVSTLRSLTKLVNVTSDELKTTIQFLDQYKDALDQTAIVSKTDKYGVITYTNKLFEEISGYTFDEVKGKTHSILRHPEMSKDVFKDLWQTITAKKVWRGTIKNRRKDGSSYVVQSVIIPILDSKGNIAEFISIRNDVTELLKREQQLKQERTDQLTGLPNRRKLIHELDETKTPLVALIDVKNFKSFNDFYGFDFADRLLIEISKCLSGFCEENSFNLFRLDGDRFAITPQKEFILRSFQEALCSIRNRINNHEYLIDKVPVEVDVVVGVGSGCRYQLQLAESALESAKMSSIEEVIPVRSEEVGKPLEFMFWLNSIKEAINENRIINFYQPIVDLKKPNEKKYEALIRMKTPSGEIISPAEFLGIAKKSRYYSKLTCIVFESAIDFSKKVKAPVSVNLSIEDIEHAGRRNHIIEHMRNVGDAKIIFEITESESINDYEVVNNFIKEVKALGAEIAIDDFGSGYSNFSYLTEMNADYIKIDGSIISQILENKKSLLITESIIDFARKLGIKVVAEFVSDEKIAQLLESYGVDYLQGYYIGKPEPQSNLNLVSNKTNH